MKRVLLVIALSVCIASATFAVQFQVHDLGPGEALDINNSGQIVCGNQVLNVDGTVVRTMQPTVHLSVINDGGAVAGTDSGRVYRWDLDGAQTLLFLGAGGISICDMNNSGVVVGQSGTGTSSRGWMRPGDGWRGNGCFGINSSGEMVGFTADYPSHEPFITNIQARHWTSAGVMTTLGPGYATAINDDGIVAGNTPEGHVGYWDAGRTFHDLGVRAYGAGGRVTGINLAGDIVGYWYNFPGNWAFYWSSSTGFIDLPVLPSGHMAVAYAINDAGQIVGTSGNRAVVWTIPEPGSAACLLCGLGTLVLLRRRRAAA